MYDDRAQFDGLLNIHGAIRLLIAKTQCCSLTMYLLFSSFWRNSGIRLYASGNSDAEIQILRTVAVVDVQCWRYISWKCLYPTVGSTYVHQICLLHTLRNKISVDGIEVLG
jgi:hypothetical protein